MAKVSPAWIKFIIGIAIIMLVLLPFLKIELALVPAILLSAAILAVIRALTGYDVFPTKISPLYAIVFLVIAGILTGLINISNLAGSFSGVTGAVGGVSQGTEVGTVNVGSCQVSSELFGKTSTFSVSFSDQMASSFTDVSPLVSTCYAYKDGVRTVGSNCSFSNFAVGDTVSVYPYLPGYYFSPVSVCIDKQSVSVQGNAWKQASASDMAITVLDENRNVMTTGDRNDYKMSLGSGDTKTIYVQLKVNSANKAFNFAGVAVAVTGNISSAKPVGYVAGYQATFLKNVMLNYNSTGTGSDTTIKVSYDAYLTNAKMMQPFSPGMIEIPIEVKTLSGKDPVDCDYTLGNQACNVIAICALDNNWEIGKDGKMYNDYYVHNDDETDAGVALGTNLNNPAGKDICTLIEVE